MLISEQELFQFELDSKRDDLFDVIVPSDVRRMLAEIRRLQAVTPDQPDQGPLYKQFFDSVWEAYCSNSIADLDDAEFIRGNAQKLGLIKETEYDPDVHGEFAACEWGVEKGDPFYVLVKQPVRESGSPYVWLDDPRTKIMLAGWKAAQEPLNDYAVHMHIRGGSLQPIPECVAAQKLWEGLELTRPTEIEDREA